MPKHTPKTLSHGRPPTTHAKLTSRPSSQVTRTTIRTHHRLQKRLSLALAKQDIPLASSLREEIQIRGGLKEYQAASLVGQSKGRGGDTSKTLCGFVDEVAGREWRGRGRAERSKEKRWKMLDVGALSADTVAERTNCFAITRIDLHSQGSDILKQDFMDRPCPKGSEEKFDIICLSLVLNYVPDAQGRGEMLKRVCEFLIVPLEKGEAGNIEVISAAIEDADKPNSSTKQIVPFPALFLVLPAPCITNSRYLNQSHLSKILHSLGFQLVKAKTTAKLAYYLFHWHGPTAVGSVAFTKKEIVSGRARNNFAIILD